MIRILIDVRAGMVEQVVCTDPANTEIFLRDYDSDATLPNGEPVRYTLTSILAYPLTSELDDWDKAQKEGIWT